jgi:hypothetical protein
MVKGGGLQMKVFVVIVDMIDIYSFIKLQYIFVTTLPKE